MSFTTPYVDMVTNELVIALVKPLTVDGKFIGVMGADTVLDTLVANVLNYKQSESGFAFIVEKSGTIIVHPEKSYIMRAKLQRIEPALDGKVGSFEHDRVGTISYRGADGRDNLLSFKQITGSDWFLCITVPREEAYSLTRKTTMVFAMEIVLRVLGFLLLMVLLALSAGSAVIFLFSRRYSTAVQQHQEELHGISRDLEWNITKRMEVETYYKTLFNVANDAILISNDLAYVECNEKAVEMFGLPREELLKRPSSTAHRSCSPTASAAATASPKSCGTHATASRSCSAGPSSGPMAWSFRPPSG